MEDVLHCPLHIFVELVDFIREICILKERLGLICLCSKTYPSGFLYFQSHLKPASWRHEEKGLILEINVQSKLFAIRHLSYICLPRDERWN